MPKIERRVLIPYQGKNYILHVFSHSDARSILDAQHELEKKLGKMRGSLKKEIEAILDDIVVMLK